MSTGPTPQARRSRYSVAATILFGGATLAFGLLWYRPVHSGIEHALTRGAAGVSFGAMWALGALCLGLDFLQATRKRRAPRLAKAPAVLAVAGALSCGWVALGRATAERLVTSAARGDAGWVARCLRRGIRVDARYEALLGFGGRRTSETALQAAAAGGHLEVVELLLAAGADPEQADGDRTPCDAAIAAGHVAVVERLLEAGASLAPRGRAEASGEESALSLALRGPSRADYPFEAMVEVLLEAGAEPAPPALLHRALELEDLEPARVLAAAIRARDPEPGESVALLSALARAEEGEALRLWRTLSDNRSDRERDGIDDIALLHLGARTGCAALCRALLDAGVPVDAARAERGVAVTALHHGVVQGQEKVVELLVDRGADIERRDGAWGTALHRACVADEPDVGAILIRAGADVEAPRSPEIPEPPLFSCVVPGSPALARLLVEAGANPTVRDAQGRTPEERSRAHGKEELAKVLRGLAER